MILLVHCEYIYLLCVQVSFVHIFLDSGHVDNYSFKCSLAWLRE